MTDEYDEDSLEYLADDPASENSPPDQETERTSGRDEALEQLLAEAREEAITEYRKEQDRLNSVKQEFHQAGYAGLAEDFLALNPEAEPSSGAVHEFLAERGLEPRTAEPAEPSQPAGPQIPAAVFHQSGPTSAAEPRKYTGKELMEMAKTDPLIFNKVRPDQIVKEW